MIELTETLKQFTDATYGRFKVVNSNTNVFISASEICDLCMVPADPNNSTTLNLMRTQGKSWWDSNYKRTGDNVRERIYATVYPKLTTKSNTYTVHFRVQSLKQSAQGQKAGTWTEGVDSVTGEYRGSTLIERFINPDADIPDYAHNLANGVTSDDPLDKYYKWRVLQNTQFAP
jgi:hypothetical protein